MMNLVQGDCKCGALAFVAGENLSAATGLLVKLSSAGKAVKPGAVSDIAPYVVACGAFEGYLCGVVPLSSAANCRVTLKGACQPGSLLVSAGDGRVEAGTLSGTAVPVGIAEETGVDGQRVLLRPLAVGARGAAGAAGADGAAGSDGGDGGVFKIAAADFLAGDYPEFPEDLVGKVIEAQSARQWVTHGIPLRNGSLGLLALVLGYGSGVFTCRFLWNYNLVNAPSGPVSVPVGMIQNYGGAGYYGVMVDISGYFILSGTVDGFPFSVAEMSVLLGEAGGKAVLAFCPGA